MISLPDTITLKADEKVVRNSIIFTWVIILSMILGGGIILKGSLEASEPLIGKTISLFLAALFIWVISVLISVNRKEKRQLRDQTTLYEITKVGITDVHENTYMWSDFKKIYYYKASVHLLEKGKIINAVILSPSSIELKAFKEACLYIKNHAPPEITKSFNPR